MIIEMKPDTESHISHIPKIGYQLQTLNFQTVSFSSSHHKSKEKFTFQSVMIFSKKYVETCSVTWPAHWRTPVRGNPGAGGKPHLTQRSKEQEGKL